jgi:CheY-like chemotaxis protein
VRIVFCEDEPMIRKLVELALRGMGHELRLVGDGVAALELVRRWRPDVLVTDVAMPGMDGVQLAAAVRADPGLSDLPIVFTTASTLPDHAEGAIAVDGRTSYLGKPFGPGALLAVLASLDGTG